jgi:glycine cleavage system H lipoate-binding protein
MIAILVVLTFLAAVLIDHLINRNPIPVTTGYAEDGAPAEAPRPRRQPAFVSGFALPDNLRYHPGHTWAVSEGGDLVRVGIDDLAAKVAGPIASIDTPKRGQWIRQGQKVFALRHDGREVELASPIEGTVVAVNDAALSTPSLAQKDPYGDGWLLVVNAPDSSTNFRNLLGGTVARRWMDDAVARLRTLATPAPAFAQDGGVAMTDLPSALPDADWKKLQSELFL